MKIAVASDDGQTVADHFGRTRGFVIFELEEDKLGESSYRDNDFTGHAQGRSVGHAPILRALGDCQVVCARGMGRRLYNDLAEAGIEVFIVEDTDVADVARLYVNKKLQDNPDKGCEH